MAKPTTTTKPAPASTATATATVKTAPPAPKPAFTPTPAKPTVSVATKATTGCCSGNTSCSTPNYEQIAQRAYEIWVSKGRPSGQDIENWKQAEAELTRGKLVTAA